MVCYKKIIDDVLMFIPLVLNAEKMSCYCRNNNSTSIDINLRFEVIHYFQMVFCYRY